MDPQQKPKSTPKDFFLHLGIIITLYISTISLLNLLFEAINVAFPDKLDYYVDPYSSALRWSIASLLIIFPIFLVLSWLSSRDIKRDPTRAEVGVRKWLTYLTLFLAGAAIVTDLVTLINTFLGGEITTRFALKVVAVLIVLGIVFWYYIYDLRKALLSNGYRKIGTVVSVALVVVSIVGGFAIIGSPNKARAMKFDMTRAQDLQNLQQQIVSYWQQKGSLPKSLIDMKNSGQYYGMVDDPETATPYEYSVKGALTFSLCATFSRSNEKDPVSDRYSYYSGNSLRHGAGRVCVDKTIDPDLNPPIKR